jgi:hypothetical protein
MSPVFELPGTLENHKSPLANIVTSALMGYVVALADTGGNGVAAIIATRSEHARGVSH